MRNVVNQLGRVVSVLTVVVLLTAPTTKGASFLLDRDGDSGRVEPGIARLIHRLVRWMPSIINDDLIVPRP